MFIEKLGEFGRILASKVDDNTEPRLVKFLKVIITPLYNKLFCEAQNVVRSKMSLPVDVNKNVRIRKLVFYDIILHLGKTSYR